MARSGTGIVVVERSVIRSLGTLAYSVHNLTSLNTYIKKNSSIPFCFVKIFKITAPKASLAMAHI